MEILKVSDVGIQAAAARAAGGITMGGIVVYPTDTLYGLGVNALDLAALRRLRELKGREKKKPVSILVASISAMERHATLTDSARRLAERFLPGALTLVLPARAHVPKEVTLNDAIGMRIPRDDFSLALAQACAHPVTATSANLAGLQTPTTIPEIIMHFGRGLQHIDLFIDDGPRAGGVSSTVVSCIDDTPRILREGAIAREMLGL